MNENTGKITNVRYVSESAEYVRKSLFTLLIVLFYFERYRRQ